MYFAPNTAPFSYEQTPVGLDSIADVAGVADLLARRGYTPDNIKGVMHGNFLRFLREAWA
jgi:membrane dipeptidase